MEQNRYDVAIVGGGPAGIATGLTLTALGVSNCIIEATTLPRQKYGEALPPNAKPILRQLDLLTLVEDDHHIKYFGNKSCWGSDQALQDHFISDIHGNGYLLDRTYFENQLWKKYLAIGGNLYNGCKLRNLSTSEDGLTLSLLHKHKNKAILCKYAVDATGRKASVCRLLGFNKVNMDHQFALSMVIPAENQMEHQILVEATQNGWWYAAPNGKGDISLMFFTLKTLLPSQNNLSDFLISNLASSLHLTRLISISILKNIKIQIIPSGSSRLETPYGKNWVAVGDAAFSFDPISSFGITSALASGYYAGRALERKMAGKKEAMMAYRSILENSFSAYLEKLEAHYATEKRWPESPYWRGRL